MKVRRNIASTPRRSARETWLEIVKLISAKDSVDADQLHAASSIASAAIGDEHARMVPIVVKGTGPRLVIYCLYGEDAIESEERPPAIDWNPTAGEWSLTIPCDRGDVAWMNRALADVAPRISAHAFDDVQKDDSSEVEAPILEFDWSAVEKS